MKVQVFIPCFIDQLYPQVAISMIRVLRKAGCEIVYPVNQTCCGQPAFNAGFHEDAIDVCNKFIKDFSADLPVVGPSASCVGFVQNHFRELLEGKTNQPQAEYLSNNIFEFADFLVNHLQVTEFDAQLNVTATYHDSCAALREVGIKKEPRALLSNVKGLNLVEMAENETCCGFGGTFAVKFADISNAMAEQKLEHATATQADLVISTDTSCLMHLQGTAGLQHSHLKFMHLAEVLASGW